MRALVASNDTKVTSLLREVLQNLGMACPDGSVMSLSAAPAGLASLASGDPDQAPDVVFLVMSSDVEQSMETLQTLRSQTGAQLFTIGPATDSKLVLRILRQGADEFLDQAELASELTAAIERFRTALAGSQHSSSRLISVLPASGGCGCSTLAASLAVTLAQSSAGCVLLDLNTEFGDLGSLLDLRSDHSLADLCQSLNRLDRYLFEAALVKHSSGLRLLAAPSRLSDVPRVNWEGIERTLQLASEVASFVVVDLPHTLRPEVFETLSRSDTILLVLRLDFTSLRHARRLMDALRDVGVVNERVTAVVNRHKLPGEVPVADAETALGTKIQHLLVDDPKTVIRTNNNGVPIVMQAPTSKLAGQIKALAASLQGALSPSAGAKEPTVVPHRWFPRRGS